MERSCDNCVLRKSAQGICPIFRRDTSGKAGCPCFSTEFVPCDVCGAHIITAAMLEIDESGHVHQMCQECAKLPLCATCIHKDECDFQRDATCHIPPVIAVQERQGNVIIQTQKINPERVKATCANGCLCCHDSTCFKSGGVGCRNYKTNWRN